jgi:hypothetical protein
MPSGALFLCDEARGRCTTAVGGRPLAGHATISALPIQTLGWDTSPGTVSEFAHAVADSDASSRFSGLSRLQGRSGLVEYLLVKQTFTTGGINERPDDVCLYFVKARQQMFELILNFNRDAPKASEYRDVAVRLISSVRLQEKAP